ncbi:MAG TPA: hypothetical protein VFC73_05925 [Syntrophomonadaceae bacterium]|nr:hypothetical protein [Syntrophomonadaceae bacterium]
MYYKTLLVISLVFFFNCNLAYSSDLPISKIVFTPSSEATALEYENIVKVTECFDVYTAFFEDIYFIDDKIISLHNESANNALVFLQKGFNEEIAFNILDYYTHWDEDINKLTIVPKEGIPVFTEKDIENCSFYYNDESLTLKINYFDPYGLNIDFTYYVTAYKVDDKYIINDLHWREYHSPNQIPKN